MFMCYPRLFNGYVICFRIDFFPMEDLPLFCKAC